MQFSLWLKGIEKWAALKVRALRTDKIIAMSLNKVNVLKQMSVYLKATKGLL